MKKDILVSEADFKELERKAALYETIKNKNEQKIIVSLHVGNMCTGYYSGVDILKASMLHQHASQNLPAEVKVITDELFEKVRKEVLKYDYEKKENFELNKQLNKIPKFIRYAFK